MKKRNLKIKLGVLFLLVAGAACVLPGQGSSPAPTSDPNFLGTVIAGTAQAAASQTQQAVLNAPATATVSVENQMPTPEISAAGTSLILHEDQSATFIDQKAGIQFTVPPGWLAVRPNEQELSKAFSLDAVVASQEIINQLTSIQNANTNFYRLSAIDIREGHVIRGIVSYITVIFQEGDMRSLEELEQAERASTQLLADFKVISSSYPQTANGTRVLVLEESWAATPEIVYYRGVFFSLPTGSLVLGFYSNILAKDSVLPDFEQVVNSVTPLDP